MINLNNTIIDIFEIENLLEIIFNYFVEIIFDHIVEGFFTGLTAVIIYFFIKYMDSKQLNTKLAKTLSIELENTARLLNQTTRTRYLTKFDSIIMPISRKMYDGFVSSGNIINLDQKLQERLYQLYTYESKNQYEQVRLDLSVVLGLLEQFIKKNRRFRYF